MSHGIDSTQHLAGEGFQTDSVLRGVSLYLVLTVAALTVCI